MPGTYGTAAFKASGRRDPKPNVRNDGSTYTAPGVASGADTKLPAAAAFRSKSPRFRDTAQRTTASADFYVPAGMAQGAGVNKAPSAAFKQSEPRFRDPTHPVVLPGRLDGDLPVEGLSDKLAKSNTGTAAFRTTSRFKPDPRVGVTPQTPAHYYVPPGVGDGTAKRVPVFKRDGTQRFREYSSRPVTAGIDGYNPPGFAAEVLKKPGGSFEKGSPRWEKTLGGARSTSTTPSAAGTPSKSPAPRAKSPRSPTYYVPPSIAETAKGGATAAFKASPRFKEPDSKFVAGGRARSRSPTADLEGGVEGGFYVAAGLAEVATSRPGPASAAFRSHSPRFDRVRSETTHADYAPLEAMASPPKACPASANFRSRTPRTPRSPSQRGTATEYFSPPSFVDEILKR